MHLYNKYDLFGTQVDPTADTKYSWNCLVPQYLPKNECPRLVECVNTKKYEELISEIEKSSVTNEEKEFLKLAATRHLVFTYAKIADYYAHASAEMQSLMEKSALVIIDFEDALANGYIELTEQIEAIAKKSKSYKQRIEKYEATQD